MKTLSEVEWKVLYCSLSTSLSYLMIGYSYGFPSPIAREVKSDNLLDDYQFGIFSGILYLSAAFGGLTAIPLMYCMSRKSVIITAVIISTAGWIVLGSSRLSYLLICGRVVTGLGSGISIPIVPIYVGELANKKTRGRHIGISSFQLSFGILVVYVLGIQLNYFWLSVIGACICILQLILLLFVPYSPTHLADIGLEKRALSTLENLRCRDYDAMSEVLEIIEAVKNQKMSLSSKISTLFKPHNMKAFIATMLLMTTNQSSGTNVISSYTSELLDNDLIDANIIGLVNPLSLIIGSALSVILIDKLGRKVLLLISYIGIMITLLLFGIYFLLIDVICPGSLHSTLIMDMCVSPYLISWPIICIATFSITYCIGIGSVCYVIMGELIPLKFKHIITCFGAFVLYTTTFLLVTTFPIITQEIPRCYYVFGICLLSAVLSMATLILTPETKGRSVAELEKLFIDKSIFICNYV